MKSERTGQVLHLTGKVTMADLKKLGHHLDEADIWGPGGVVLTIDGDGPVNLSRLDRILNVLMSRLPGRPLVLAAPSPAVLHQLNRSGLTGIFPAFGSANQALGHPALRPHSLAGVEVLLLAAGKGTRAWPLTAQSPKPMLPLLGQPLLHHLMSHCRTFGIRDFYVNISHMARAIEHHFQSGRRIGAHITYSHEGIMTAKGFVPKPLGSASTLLHLHRQHGCFDQPFIVMCGDAPTDIDLAAMMCAHVNSGAVATVATRSVPMSRQQSYGIFETNPSGRALRFHEKPGRGLTDSLTASTGIYIFDPSVMDHIPHAGNQDIGGDLLPGLIAAGRHVACYGDPFGWTDVGTFADYHRAELRAVMGDVPGLYPVAGKTTGGARVAEGAYLSPDARVEGPVFLAPGAQVDAGAWLKGPVSIGAGCRVRERSIVQQSVVLAGTEVGAGSVVSGMVAGPTWALHPDFPMASGQLLQGLEGLGPVPSKEQEEFASVA